MDARDCRANLSAEIGAAGTATALPLFGEMEKACGDIKDLPKGRIDPIQQEINRFTMNARSLAEKCASELVEEPPVEIAVRLGELLRQTQQVNDRRAHLSQAIARTQQEHDTAVQEEVLARIPRRSRPLMNCAQPLRRRTPIRRLTNALEMHVTRRSTVAMVYHSIN